MKPEYEALLRPYFENVPFPEIAGEKPLVSIITPYYNNAQYLEEFLESVFAQTYKNWEMLFVDDASPDEIAEMAVKRHNDTRIKFHRLENNSGGAVARTVGFSMSSGEYVLYFDPDDIMHPWHLQALMAEALSSKSPDIVMMNLICFGAKTAYRTSVVRTERELTTQQWIPGPSLTKRKLWLATGGQSAAPEIRFGSQDWEFWLHCFEKCAPLTVAHVPLPTFLYRQHPTALCSKSDHYEYKIRSRIIADHPSIFARYGTTQQFLAQGYAKTVFALAVVGQWRKMALVLREGGKKIPFCLYIRTLARWGIQKARTALSIHVKRPLFRALGIPVRDNS